MNGRVLLVIPPLTQLNTPYPSTAYLTGFLKSRGYSDTIQADLGIEMVLRLFSRVGLERVFHAARKSLDIPGEAQQMLALESAYLDSIEAVVAFLQGRDPALSARISRGGFLPEGPRFSAFRDRENQEHSVDHARRLATLYLEDLADLVHTCVSPHFALSRYAEHVGTAATSFEPVQKALAEPLSLTDEMMVEAMWRHVEEIDPAVVGLSVPFPGNLYGALRIAQALKARRPDTVVVLGGGYVNTELRRLQEPRLFKYVDFVTLDDGERPLLCLLEYLAGKREEARLCRTYVQSNGHVVFRDGANEREFTMAELGTPTYEGLPLDRYISVLDTLNPMHRLWSDGHWNKLTVAHGCYWKQCTFCDVGLDYIGRYEATPSDLLADRIEALVAETGRRGFHFVDEAAPPAGLKGLALALLERGLTISWWGNIRFEAAFSPDLCRLLAASGCIAMSAGLEAASDRLLTEMKKGITVEQAARVAAALRAAGILVHAYLMYGLPGETVDETIESLERVRQLFGHGLIQSAFWHKFTATAHSPIGLDPTAHGIRITGPVFGGFAENDLSHDDPRGEAPGWLGAGLRRALLHYMEGEGLTTDVRSWFQTPAGRRLKRPAVRRDWLRRMLEEVPDGDMRALRTDQFDGLSMWERRLVWIGGTPVMEPSGRERVRLILPGRREDHVLQLTADQGQWLMGLIQAATPVRRGRSTVHGKETYPSLKEVRVGCPYRDVAKALRSAAWGKARAAGLLLV